MNESEGDRPHWNSFAPGVAMSPSRCYNLHPPCMAPSLHIPKYLRPLGVVTWDPSRCLLKLMSFYFFLWMKPDTWLVAHSCSLDLSSNLDFLACFLSVGSKNTEADFSLGPLLLGSLERNQTLGKALSSLSIGRLALPHQRVSWEVQSWSTSVPGLLTCYTSVLERRGGVLGSGVHLHSSLACILLRNSSVCLLVLLLPTHLVLPLFL